MEYRFSDQPDREHGNPLKPVRTRDDVDKNLVYAILAGFRLIFPTLRVNFLRFFRFFQRIRRYDVTTRISKDEFTFLCV